MTIKRTLSSAFALVLLAVTLGVAIGEPPPKEPPQPDFTARGATAVLADTPRDPAGGLPTGTRRPGAVVALGDPDDGGERVAVRKPHDPPVITGEDDLTAPRPDTIIVSDPGPGDGKGPK